MSLTSLMNQTVNHYASTGKDRYGKDTFAPAKEVKGRVEIKNRSRLLADGHVIMIAAVGYFENDSRIDINDKLNYEGVDYKVHSKDLAITGRGSALFIKVELTRWV